MAEPGSKSPKTAEPKDAGDPLSGLSPETQKIISEAKRIRDRERHDELLGQAAGIKSVNAARVMVDQVTNTVWRPTGQSAADAHDARNGAIGQMMSYEPKDVLEGMLISQMIGTHNAAMECIRRAQLSNQTFQGHDENLKHAAKLMGIFTRQVEALDKHRNRGQQRITVEHVHVHDGGKAIIGDVGVGANSPAQTVPSEPLALANAPGPLAPVMDQIEGEAIEPVRVRKTSNGG